jgi:hypothetical protein
MNWDEAGKFVVMFWEGERMIGERSGRLIRRRIQPWRRYLPNLM